MHVNDDKHERRNVSDDGKGKKKLNVEIDGRQCILEIAHA